MKQTGIKAAGRLLILLIAAVFYSCTASNTGTPDKISIDDLKNRVNRNSQKLRSLNSYGTISIDTPEESNTGSITVSLIKPDSVYTKISGPFGISVASILLTRTNFIYYNIMENYVIKGSSTPLNIGAILRVRMEFDEILSAYSGTFILENANESNSVVSADEGQHLLIVDAEGTEQQKYWIDPERFYVTKYAIHDKAAKKDKLIIQYSEFITSEGIYFPKKIDISKPDEKQFVYLTYSEYDFNENKLDYRLKIPKSAKVTEWD